MPSGTQLDMLSKKWKKKSSHHILMKNELMSECPGEKYWYVNPKLNWYAWNQKLLERTSLTNKQYYN